MALSSTDLFASATNPAQLRYFPDAAGSIQPKTFAQGSALLPKGLPVSFNEATNFWGPLQGLFEVSLFTAHASTPATAGDFFLVVNGEITADIAFDATPAEMQTAIEALGGVKLGDIVVAESGGGFDATDGLVTFTWGAHMRDEGLVVTMDQVGISAGSDGVFSESTAGVDGTAILAGFLWPDELQLLASNESLGQVMLKGRIHFDDIPVSAGNYTEAQLKASLRSDARKLGYIIEGLADFR